MSQYYIRSKKSDHEESRATLPNLTAVMAAGGWKLKGFGLRLATSVTGGTLGEIASQLCFGSDK